RRKLGSRPARLLLSSVFEQAGQLIPGYTIHLVAKVAGQLNAGVFLQHCLDFPSAQCRDKQEGSLPCALAMKTRLDIFETMSSRHLRVRAVAFRMASGLHGPSRLNSEPSGWFAPNS